MAVEKNAKGRWVSEKLSWDTDYFGVLSARVSLLESINRDDIKLIKEQTEEYEFVTINNIGNKSVNNATIALLKGVILTDVNVQFQKKVCLQSTPSDSSINIIEINDRNYFNQDILEISKKAFSFSRFYNDPFLDRTKAANLYAHWVESAFMSHGKRFIVSEDSEGVNGFLLFHDDSYDETATIELIATNPRVAGKGIGTKLMKKLDEFLSETLIKEIHVGTQLNNLKALNFYINNGYRISSANAIYHFWPKRKVVE